MSLVSMEPRAFKIQEFIFHLKCRNLLIFESHHPWDIFNTKILTSNYENYDSVSLTPLSRGLESTSFYASVTISIGSSIPILLDFLFDALHSSTREIHPAKSAVWLVLLSTMMPNILFFVYIIPYGRVEYWPPTISLETTILVTSGCVLFNAYGSTIFTWNWVFIVQISINIAQIVNSFIPFVSPTMGNTIAYIQLLFYLSCFFVTGFLVARWMTYIRVLTSLFIIGYATTGSTYLDLDGVNISSRILVFTASLTMSMVLNMRHIRESLELAKIIHREITNNNRNSNSNKKNENSNNSNNNMDSMYVDASTVSLVEDLQGSCQSAVDILNDLLVYESLSGKDMGSMEMMTRTVRGPSFLIHKINALMIQARQKGVSMEVINADEIVDDHNTAEVIRERQTQSQSQSEYNLRISVHDNGPEILERDRDVLFNSELRFTAGVLETREGKGLGLWISHRVMELHKGRLYLEPQNENTGNTFIIEIPIVIFLNCVDHSTVIPQGSTDSKPDEDTDIDENNKLTTLETFVDEFHDINLDLRSTLGQMMSQSFQRCDSISTEVVGNGNSNVRLYCSKISTACFEAIQENAANMRSEPLGIDSGNFYRLFNFNLQI
eukprot:gene6110-12371_t